MHIVWAIMLDKATASRRRERDARRCGPKTGERRSGVWKVESECGGPGFGPAGRVAWLFVVAVTIYVRN